MRILWILCLVLFVSVVSHAQTATDCPADKVCLTVQQARQALIDADTVKAQKIQVEAQEKTIEGLRDELDRLRIELAKLTGDKTGAEQMNVRLTAIIDLLLKNVRPKKVGLINF